MSFRFDMQNKTPEQQAIVRKRDEEERLLKKERQRQKEIEIQKEEFYQLDELLKSGFKYSNSVEHGGFLEIKLTNLDKAENKSITLKNKDNIENAKKLLNILD